MNIYKCKQCGGFAAFDSAESHDQLKCPYCGHVDYAMAWHDTRNVSHATCLTPADLQLISSELARLPEHSDMANNAFNAFSTRFGLSTFSLMQIANVLCNNARTTNHTLRLHRFTTFTPGPIDGPHLLQRIKAELTRISQAAVPSQSPWEQKYTALQNEHNQLKRDCETLRKRLKEAMDKIKELS